MAHPATQGELRRLVRLFESAIGGLLLDGEARLFTTSTAAQQDRRLAAWARSRLPLRRTGYRALKRLVYASYYAAPETWAAIGYAGPPLDIPRRWRRRTMTAATKGSQPGRILTGRDVTADVDERADVCVIGAAPAAPSSPPARERRGTACSSGGGRLLHPRRLRHAARRRVPRLYQEAMQRHRRPASPSCRAGPWAAPRWSTGPRASAPPDASSNHWSRAHRCAASPTPTSPRTTSRSRRASPSTRSSEAGEMNGTTASSSTAARRRAGRSSTTRRNVYSACQTGYCGTGCPINAKRSMLVTTYIPDALDAGRAPAVPLPRRSVEAAGAPVHARRTARCSTPARYAADRQARRVQGQAASSSRAAPSTPRRCSCSGAARLGRPVGTRTFLHPAIGITASTTSPSRPSTARRRARASHQFAHAAATWASSWRRRRRYPVLGRHRAAGLRRGPPRSRRARLAPCGAHRARRSTASPRGRPAAPSPPPLRPPRLDYPIPPAVWEALRDGAEARSARSTSPRGARGGHTLHDPSRRDPQPERYVAKSTPSPGSPAGWRSSPPTRWAGAPWATPSAR